MVRPSWPMTSARLPLVRVHNQSEKEIAFRPARVLMQDFTGVPAIVDLATMRDVIKKMGGDPKKINPLQQVDLVIDHSVQVDQFGTPGAFAFNADRELERNRERYIFLKWGQKAFHNCRVVPPDVGIVHQVNLEYIAPAVFVDRKNGRKIAYPDTLVGTDSHTTMINGLGVVGWGVGGIEAEGAMLGQPLSMLIPPVVGFKLYGQMKEGTTATDVVLTVTQMLRAKGVVGKFVEFYGSGFRNLSLADRATIANMAPGVWSDDRILSYRFGNAQLSAAQRAGSRTRQAGRGVCQGAGPVPNAKRRPIRRSATRWNWTSRPLSQALRAHGVRRIECRWPNRNRFFRKRCRQCLRSRPRTSRALRSPTTATSTTLRMAQLSLQP